MAKLTREDVERIVKEARERSERPDLSRVDLSGVDLSGVDLSGALLIGANLSGTNLSGVDLSGALLIGANLNKANLNKANFSGVDLSGVDLSETDLRGADFRGATLSGVDLSKADLRGATLSGANLNDADLNDADLSRVDLNRADLRRANLNKAIIGFTSFGDVDLSVVSGLDTVTHRGPSPISTSTLYKSRDNIPEVFLRGCGLSDVQIEMAKLHNPNLTTEQITDITYKIHNLLTGDAIQYHSCFISYSHKDEDFARQLYDNLQDSGVRCWYAPEDMKIGDKIRPTIDQSIRIHDKLLLILSEQSVASEWVEHEVEHALALERERKEPVLFPIRLDGAVMDSNFGWAGTIKRGRHIGDFTRWKDHDAYQESFSRLLRDLKAGG